MISIGMIGESEGNGHPYSFSCIINGFDKNIFNKEEWPNIYDYLLANSMNEKIGFDNAKVDYVWCPDYERAKKISHSCNIKNVAKNLDELLACDAIIIARDDWASHYEISKLFLENDKYVFIDKPLTLDAKQLDYFAKFMKNGKLFSCSALRFAEEMNTNFPSIDKVSFINLTTIKNWEKYSIHVVEPLLSKYNLNIHTVKLLQNDKNIEIRALFNDENVPFIVNTLKYYNQAYFIIEIFADKLYTISISDYYKAFKNTLTKFIEMIEKNSVPIDFDNTKRILTTIIKGIN